MDFAVEYSKMCEKSAEIQGLWSPREGDYFLERVDETSPDDVAHSFYVEEYLRIIGSDDQANLCSINIANSYKQGNVWLPRQDQLQEMIIERVKCSPCKDVALAYMFHDWMIEEDGRSFGFGKAVFLNPSMEQLWLAFTMRENFQKIWNGEEWKMSNEELYKDCESLCFECGRKFGLKKIHDGVALCLWHRIKEFFFGYWT